jgi:hypothetical protein
MMMRDYNQYRVQRARVVGWCWERLGGHAVMPECGRVVKGAVGVWRGRLARIVRGRLDIWQTPHAARLLECARRRATCMYN